MPRPTASWRVRTTGHRGRPGARGFTLVELMFTLFIASVLLMIGVPAFKDVFVGAKVGSIANDLMGSVQLARSEAIKRNIPITLCRSTDGTTCDADTDWEGGWIIVDEATPTVLQHIEAQEANYKVKQYLPDPSANLVFQPIGVGAVSSCFEVFRADREGDPGARKLNISATGSTYIMEIKVVPADRCVP